MKASSLPQGDGIAETLLSAEVVSFDIFDTLVKRTVLKPTDIFEDAEYSTSNAPREVCARIRVEAERDARMLAVRQGREDTTLDEIYAIIGERLSQGDAKRLKEAEISLELSCCIPYEHMKGIYDLAKKSKARVIAVTDMYLPHDVIRQILQKCGYDDLDAIFVSSECGLTKASGGLWNHVIDSLGTAPNSIVHFGDNRRSDVDRAKAAGIIAFLVRESHDFIFRLPRREMQNEGVSKLVHYLECTRPVNQDDAAFKLGYGIIGPLLVGFVRWLHCRAQDLGVDKLLFLSRDGYLMQRVYKSVLGSEALDNSYFYASRKALIVPSLHGDASLSHVLKVVPLHSWTTLSNFFDKVGLSIDEYESLLGAYGYGKDDVIETDRLLSDGKFCEFYSALEPDIKKGANAAHAGLQRYIADSDVLGKKIALIDIGWWGRMQHALCRELEEAGPSTQVFGFYTGLRGVGVSENASSCNQGMEGFLFSPEHHTERIALEDAFNGFYEIMFSAPHGSVLRYDLDEDTGFVHVVMDRYEYEGLETASIVKRIHGGALAFATSVKSNGYEDDEAFSDGALFSVVSAVGLNPSKEVIDLFRSTTMFDGDTWALCGVGGIEGSILFFRSFLASLKRSVWRPAVLNEALGANLPFGKAYGRLLQLKRAIGKQMWPT